MSVTAKKLEAEHREPAADRPRPLAFRRLFGRKLTVNVVTDSGPFPLGAEGVLEGLQESLARLGDHPDLSLRVDDPRPADILHFIGCGPAFLYRGAMQGSRRLCSLELPSEAAGLAELARPVVHGFLRALCDRTDAVIATTPHTAGRLRDMGVRASIRTLPGAVPAAFMKSAELRKRGRSLLGLPASAAVVLGVGGLRRFEAVADFAAVARAIPEATFVWVDQEAGRGPLDPEGFDAFVAKDAANLRFAGALPAADLPALFNAADVLLHPALQASRPRVPLLAAACGVPVVLRDLPEHRELLRGDYLAAASPGGLAEAVRRLLGSDAERARWGTLSARFAERFRLEPAADALASLYDLAGCGKLAPAAPEVEPSTTKLLEWPL
ncbi:MAG TPA: glycosyltransferase family 4 protein [Myxococcales bacterium]|nr:glycosyltransferase family 4 protein [Myxococcales bacterium]